MKRITLITAALLTVITINAQTSMEEKLQDLEYNKNNENSNPDTLKTQSIGLKVNTFPEEEKEASVDTTKIRFGKRKIVIIEKDGTTSIEIPDKGDRQYDNQDGTTFKYKRRRGFNGHWSGFEWGFNGFLDGSNSINMKDPNRYLELKQGRSWNFNLNFAQYSLGLGSNKVGLVTGLGFEFNNYHFRNRNTIKIENGSVVPDYSYSDDPNILVTKSRLSTTYLTAPLLLEFQVPVSSSDRHRIYFSAGVIGGVKIGSHTKVEYESKHSRDIKNKDDYNLSPFRYGLTARLGFRGLKFFATYYPSQLFESGKGPEIYPFTLGLTLASF